MSPLLGVLLRGGVWLEEVKRGPIGGVAWQGRLLSGSALHRCFLATLL